MKGIIRISGTKKIKSYYSMNLITGKGISRLVFSCYRRGKKKKKEVRSARQVCLPSIVVRREKKRRRKER